MLYFSTADGVFDLGNSQTPTTDAADSFVKLTTDLSTVSAYFTPADAVYRWCGGNDLDFGSGGVTLVPDGVLTSWPKFAVKGDKEGGIWAIDRTVPGSFNGASCGQSCSQCANANSNIQTVLTGGYFHNNLAYWNKNLYISVVGKCWDNLPANAVPDRERWVVPRWRQHRSDLSVGGDGELPFGNHVPFV